MADPPCLSALSAGDADAAATAASLSKQADSTAEDVVDADKNVVVELLPESDTHAPADEGFSSRISTLTVVDSLDIHIQEKRESMTGGRFATVRNDNDVDLARAASMASLAELNPIHSTNFIRSTNSKDEEPQDDETQNREPPRRCRKFARKVTRHRHYEFFAGLVVLLDFVAICRDTDIKAGARQQELAAETVMHCCFAVYIVDLCLHTVVRGWTILKSKSHVLDGVVVGVTAVEYALELAHGVSGSSSVLMIRMMRLFRLLRLVRVVKLFSGMRELRRLTQMIALCARTMFWSFLMSFLVMTMWAVMAVELAHPVAQRLAEQDMWPDCERCGRAFESVMAANLTFVQTILAGDSWGKLALPICEASPMTAFVFCGALLTLTYGIMQLITAVVVDSFADLRKLDIDSLATEIDVSEKEEKAALCRIFEKIDTDNSGLVTFEELADGAMRVKEFQDWLRVMDIDGSDLARLFLIIDSDDSGEVDLTEFMDALYRMRNAESKTTTKLVKHIVDNLDRKTGQMFERIEDLQSRFEDMQKLQIQIREAGSSCPVSKDEDPMLKHVETAVQRASALALESALSAALDKVQMIMKDGSTTLSEFSPIAAGPWTSKLDCKVMDSVASAALETSAKPVPGQRPLFRKEEKLVALAAASQLPTDSSSKSDRGPRMLERRTSDPLSDDGRAPTQLWPVDSEIPREKGGTSSSQPPWTAFLQTSRTTGPDAVDLQEV
eukprot:TRINITY_DN8805_c0_g1_i1.p1 TRINITY_DN8805_c0_g1~~TRINITY_DN8805_c0_g1_i1.p1  ORF type:complete len:727 (+),score=117.94 TRINITY_DN8805_c0_g1_i1:67-2247(+)